MPSRLTIVKVTSPRKVLGRSVTEVQSSVSAGAEELKQYVSYWEVLDVRMYTPVLLAAQMETGVIRGITTCPFMNPYLQVSNPMLRAFSICAIVGRVVLKASQRSGASVDEML